EVGGSFFWWERLAHLGQATFQARAGEGVRLLGQGLGQDRGGPAEASSRLFREEVACDPDDVSDEFLVRHERITLLQCLDKNLSRPVAKVSICEVEFRDSQRSGCPSLPVLCADLEPRPEDFGYLRRQGLVQSHRSLDSRAGPGREPACAEVVLKGPLH